MKKSKKSSATKLTTEQKKKRNDHISASNEKYQDAIARTVRLFSNSGLTVEFIPEFNFMQKWRFDFYSPELGLAIEFEGGRGHVFRNRYEGDLEKYNRACIYGYPHLLRFVLGNLDEVHIQIYQFYKQRSKIHGGVISSAKIDRLDEQLRLKNELSKEK